MARLTLPGFLRSEPVEKRFDTGNLVSAGGFSFPSIDATGSSLIAQRGLEAFTSSEIAYRAVQIIANNLASLDLGIETESDSDDEVDFDTTTPLSLKWNKAPYPGISAVVMKRIAFERMELHGQSFLYTPRANNLPDGELLGMVNLFGRVTPLIDNTPGTLEQFLMPIVAGYQVQTQGRTLFLLPHEVLWLRYPDPERPWQALAPWQAALWSANLDKAAKESQEAIYRNGAEPSGVIYLGNITEEQAQRVKAGFEANHAGTNNAGKHLFLYGDAKATYNRMGSVGNESAYTISHGANQEDILHAFGVPVDLVIGQATYDNRHAAWVSLWTDLLLPKCELIESEIDRQMVPDPEQSAKLDRSNIAALQENEDAVQARADARLINDGITIGEYRTELGQEPFGDERDEMTLTMYRQAIPDLLPSFLPAEIQAQKEEMAQAALNAFNSADNSQPQDDNGDPQLAEDTQNTSGEGRLALEAPETRNAIVGPRHDDAQRAYEHYSARVSAAVSRLAAKQRKVVLRKLAKAAQRSQRAGLETRASADDIFDDAYWEDQTAEALDDPVHSAWSAGGMAMATAIGYSSRAVAGQVEPKAADRIAFTAKSVTATTHQRLDNALADNPDDPEAAVNAVFDDLEESDGETGSRALMIGESEAVSGYNGGLLTIGAASGLTMTKTWVAQSGAERLCQAVAGETVGIAETFSNGADGPELHPRCKCSLDFQLALGFNS